MNYDENFPAECHPVIKPKKKNQRIQKMKQCKLCETLLEKESTTEELDKHWKKHHNWHWETNKEKNIKCAITAIQVILPKQRGRPLILKRGLIERRHITITPTPNHPLPSNYDVVICRMIGKYDLKEYLQIKKPCKLETFDEVLCCGYPGGNIGAFNPHDLESGLRFSPTIQSGRIASVLPIDDVVNPTGIMTDIIGIGGLSGSPIVNAQDYEVIAIAQNVILADVFKNNKSVAKSKIGLVYGISNYVLSRAIDKMLPTIKKELDENGKLKPEFEEKYSDQNTTDDFEIQIS